MMAFATGLPLSFPFLLAAMRKPVMSPQNLFEQSSVSVLIGDTTNKRLTPVVLDGTGVPSQDVLRKGRLKSGCTS